MVDMPKLIGKMAEKGVTKAMLADKWGVDSSTVTRRFKNSGKDITIEEADVLKRILDLSSNEAENIFFD